MCVILKCSCGKYDSNAMGEVLAMSAARMHCMLGPEHKIIATAVKPAIVRPVWIFQDGVFTTLTRKDRG